MRKILYTLLLVLYSFSLVFSQSYKISKLENKLKKSSGLQEILVLDELAEAYLDFDTEKSILYAEKALKLSKNHEVIPSVLADIYNTLGASYYYKQKYRKSLKNYEQELDIIKKISNDKKISKSYYNVAVIYQKSGRTNKAVFNYGKSLSHAHKINSYDLIVKNHKALYQLYIEQGNKKDALTELQKYVALKDSKFYKTNKRVNILRKKYSEEKELRQLAQDIVFEKDSALLVSLDIENILKRDTADMARLIGLLKLENEFANKMNLKKAELNDAIFELKNAKIERKEAEIVYLSVISFLIFVILSWLAVLYRQKRKANKLLRDSKEEIVTQSEIIFEKNREITDSINYARRIQDSLLVSEDEIRKHLPETFIYYQPKDIVSGDFYWFSKVKDELVLAAIDCTGHGVPGAFMSLIGHTLLNEIVNEKHITKPDVILKHLHLGIMAALQQTGNDSASDDGMDMSLCTINPRQKRFRFAGAKNHLYVLQKDKLKILKANQHSVGGRPIRSDIKVEFTSYDFMYDANTSIYMLSDGYMDQFGGVQDTKFNSKRFKELLINNRDLPMQKQKEIIKDTINEWRGDREQVDDILVMGVKLN